MDRTSWIGALVCLGLLFGWGWWSSKEAVKQAEERARLAEIEAAKAPPAQDPKSAGSSPAAATGAAGTAATAPEVEVEAKESVLENDGVKLHLTTRGAGIRVAELRDHKRFFEGDENITINRTASNGVAVLSEGPGLFDSTNWEFVSQDATSATYKTTTPAGFELTKTFTLPTGTEYDSHEVLMELTVKNAAKTPLNFANNYLYTGSAAPLHLNEMSMQIGMYWMDKSGEFDYETVDHFGREKKTLGIFGKGLIPSDSFGVEQLDWAGVNDQFFTTMIRAEEPYATKLWASRFPVVVEDDEAASVKKRMFAAEMGVGLPDLSLNPGDEKTLSYSIYLGPKEFSRLKGLGDQRERVMHYDAIPIFGFLFGWAIKPLASWLIMGLVALNGLVGNYGIAIIIITILIRLLIWPVYAKSARSMKRMSKLTPLMKEIKEKYEDDPQKMNQETMKLYQTYGINPLGGCLPMFIQLPVFLAFYRMLWSAVELRHESFLWVDDLSMPDYLFTIPGLDIPFNLLPILMGLTSFIQIAITPKTGDKTQQMIFMFMPIIFLVICYNFAAALALYWTTSNAFSILQTWLMNKMPEPELKKKATSGKKGFMARMQEQAEAAQKAKAAGGSPGPGGAKSRTKMPGEKGDRHTKGKKKRR